MRSPTVMPGAGGMLVVEDFLLQGALVGVGGAAADASLRVRFSKVGFLEAVAVGSQSLEVAGVAGGGR